MSKLATSLIIDQKAALMAESVEKGYDLAKYRQHVMKELSDGDGDDNTN